MPYHANDITDAATLFAMPLERFHYACREVGGGDSGEARRLPAALLEYATLQRATL